MSNAGHDSNSRPTLICASKLDGVTIVPIKADPTTHGVKNDDGATGTDNGNNGGNAMMDENMVSVATALSSDGSGRIIEIYGDASNGKLLIKST
jgi:hypothetical protein